MPSNVETKRCGCGAILRARQSCERCASAARARLHAAGVAKSEKKSWQAYDNGNEVGQWFIPGFHDKQPATDAPPAHRRALDKLNDAVRSGELVLRESVKQRIAELEQIGKLRVSSTPEPRADDCMCGHCRVRRLEPGWQMVPPRQRVRCELERSGKLFAAYTPDPRTSAGGTSLTLVVSVAKEAHRLTGMAPYAVAWGTAPQLDVVEWVEWPNGTRTMLGTPVSPSVRPERTHRFRWLEWRGESFAAVGAVRLREGDEWWLWRVEDGVVVFEGEAPQSAEDKAFYRKQEERRSRERWCVHEPPPVGAEVEWDAAGKMG